MFVSSKNVKTIGQTSTNKKQSMICQICCIPNWNPCFSGSKTIMQNIEIVVAMENDPQYFFRKFSQFIAMLCLIQTEQTELLSYPTIWKLFASLKKTQRGRDVFYKQLVAGSEPSTKNKLMFILYHNSTRLYSQRMTHKTK